MCESWRVGDDRIAHQICQHGLRCVSSVCLPIPSISESTLDQLKFQYLRPYYLRCSSRQRPSDIRRNAIRDCVPNDFGCPLSNAAKKFESNASKLATWSHCSQPGFRLIRRVAVEFAAEADGDQPAPVRRHRRHQVHHHCLILS